MEAGAEEAGRDGEAAGRVEGVVKGEKEEEVVVELMLLCVTVSSKPASRDSHNVTMIYTCMTSY